MIRIAFPFISNKIWPGGYNYLQNLFIVISHHQQKKFQPVIFIGTDIEKKQVNAFLKIKNVEIVTTSTMNKSRKNISLIKSYFLGVDKDIQDLFKKKKINIVFENANFYGRNLGIPAIAWMPDFQHRALPHLFSQIAWCKREIGFRAQISSARSIMLSSIVSIKDCKRYYPKSIGSTNLVRFATQLIKIPNKNKVQSVKKLYSLPDKYFYLPNQFWEHKNHLLVIKALNFLKEKGHNIVIVSSGKQLDPSKPKYFKNFSKTLIKLKLQKMFLLLSLIPYDHVLCLMIGSVSVLNPSLFEGRSSTVEEGIALKVPLILSNINIHKEQAGNKANFFQYNNYHSLAKVLLKIWNQKKKVSSNNQKMSKINSNRVKTFAHDFDNLIKNTIDTFYKINSKKIL